MLLGVTFHWPYYYFGSSRILQDYSQLITVMVMLPVCMLAQCSMVIVQEAKEVAARHFAAARLAMRPALTKQALEQYASWRRNR